MKSKLLLISCFFIFITTYSTAQFEGFGKDNYTVASIYRLPQSENNNNVNKAIDLSTIKGSPYENNSFLFGRAYDKLTNKSMPFYLRYDAYKDIIEMKVNSNDKNTMSLIKSVDIYAVINKNEYQYKTYSDGKGNTNEGYLLLLHTSKNSNLYLKKIKKFKDVQKSENLLHKDKPISFKDLKIFYIEKGKGLFPLSSNKKGLLLQLTGKDNQLSEFIKKEKINLKKENDLVKLFVYYDSLF